MRPPETVVLIFSVESLTSLVTDVAMTIASTVAVTQVVRGGQGRAMLNLVVRQLYLHHLQVSHQALQTDAALVTTVDHTMRGPQGMVVSTDPTIAAV